MVFTPFTEGEVGNPATFNARLQEIADYIDALGESLLPVIVPWTTLADPAALITLTGISQLFTSLKLVALLRTDQVATKSTLILRLNNDSTEANYYAYQVQAAAAVALSTQSGSGTAGFDMKDMCTAASAPANVYGLVVVELPGYILTTTKGMLYSGYCQGSLVTTTEYEYHTGGGNYLGASPVSRIDLIPGSGSFVAGSQYALYGVL